MKAFLWHEIDECTSNYHSNGSVLIEAETLERARELAIIHRSEYDSEPSAPMSGIEAEPDLILESKSEQEKVWVFPNAGCC